MAQVLDDLSDLTLTIGTELVEVEPISYKVCSKTLARASPVLKRMLYGNFVEAKPEDGEWLVKLPEDDPKAFGTILKTVHGQFDAELEPMTLEALHAVATIADKYDLARALASRVFFWRDSLVALLDASCIRPFELSSGWGLPQLLQALWVSWVFGDTESVERCMYCLGIHAKATDQGQIELDESSDQIGVFGMSRTLLTYNHSASTSASETVLTGQTTRST